MSKIKIDILDDETEFNRHFTPIFTSNDLVDIIGTDRKMYLNYRGKNDMAILKKDCNKTQLIVYSTPTREVNLEIEPAMEEFIESVGAGTYLYLPQRNSIAFTYESDILREADLCSAPNYQEWSYYPNTEMISNFDFYLMLNEAVCDFKPFKIGSFSRNVLSAAFYGNESDDLLKLGELEDVKEDGIMVVTGMMEKVWAVPRVRSANIKGITKLFNPNYEANIAREQLEEYVEFILEEIEELEPSQYVEAEFRDLNILPEFKNDKEKTKYLEEVGFCYLSKMKNVFNTPKIFPAGKSIDIIQDMTLGFDTRKMIVSGDTILVKLSSLHSKFTTESLIRCLRASGIFGFNVVKMD